MDMLVCYSCARSIYTVCRSVGRYGYRGTHGQLEGCALSVYLWPFPQPQFSLLLAQLGLSCSWGVDLVFGKSRLWTWTGVGWNGGFATLALWSSVTPHDPLLIREAMGIT